MKTITVTDALAELTLLEKRIKSATAALGNNNLITVVEVEKVPTGFRSRQEYETKARATYREEWFKVQRLNLKPENSTLKN